MLAKSAALELAWKVFSEYESPDYAPEGTQEFRKCLHDENYLAGIEYYGAFDEEKTVNGILSFLHFRVRRIMPVNDDQKKYFK